MISHAHKCVFIHIPKCGGQSVEHIFLKANNLTWERRAPLLLRPNDKASLGPPRLAHLTYQDYIKYGYASLDLMKNYTVFSIVRDPYKRVESLYRFWGYDTAIPFEDFVLKVLSKQLEEQGEHFWFFRPQYDFICDSEGAISVDYLIKLEDMNEKLPSILNALGIEVAEIPHVNRAKEARSLIGTFKERLRHAKNGVYSSKLRVNGKVIWTEAAIQKVQSLYINDFKYLGYS